MNSEVPYKDNGKAEAIKLKGNRHFSQAQNQEALQCYDQAVLYSEHGTSTLATSLANRSAVFQHINDWQACLDDITLALELVPSNPDIEALEKKWQQRKATAVKEIKKQSKSQTFKTQPLYNGEHATIAGMSSAVEVVTDATKGRKMIAKVPIPAGSLIIRDKPLGWEILPEFAGKVCHQCCQPLNNFWLPCAVCAREGIRYCSTSCRDASWIQFHQFECPMPFGYQSGVMRAQPGEVSFKNSNSRLIAQRIMTGQSASSLVDADPDKPTVKDVVAKLGTSEQNGVYDHSLRSVMSLMSRHVPDLEINDQTYTFSSTAQDGYLKQDAWPKSMKTSARKQLCVRMLNELCDRIRVNSWGIKVLFNDGSIEDVGSGLYPTGSLLNHSCLPNVCESFDGCVAEWRARYDIQPGTEICTTYCPHFGVQRRQDRLQHLLNGYGFSCDCDACNVNDYEQMEKWLYGFQCVVCKIPAEEEILSEDGELVCHKCGVLTYNANQIRDAADAIKQETNRRMHQGNLDVKEAMQLLKKLDPMLGKRSELNFQLRATIGKSLCGFNDAMAVAMIEQLVSQRKQFYGDTAVMAWLNGIVMSVHFMVDEKSTKTRQLIREEVQRLIVKTGLKNTRRLLNGVPQPMGPHLIRCFENIANE